MPQFETHMFSSSLGYLLSLDMKKYILSLTIIYSLNLSAQQWITPVIDGYGEIKYSQQVAVQPEADLDYKLIYKITSSEERNGVIRGLNSIAHSLNMLGAAKVPTTKIQVVSSISGPATSLILTDEAYQKKYGKKNPNTALINLLAENGVKLYVCSQAVAYKKIKASDINPNITSALSGASVMANYQLKGYVRM